MGNGLSPPGNKESLISVCSALRGEALSPSIILNSGRVQQVGGEALAAGSSATGTLASSVPGPWVLVGTAGGNL